VPTEVVAAGAWWRLLTATFLHFGFVHLLLNMLGLAVLVPFVERQLGWIRYTLSYLAAGVGSMTTITILAIQGLSRTTFALGASGAVMGLIGAEAGILLLLWRRRPSRFVGQRLRLLGLLMTLQTFFDLTMPHTSFIGHISGVVLGLIAGLIFQSNVETGAQE
jgi:rhomboid protease GluP